MSEREKAIQLLNIIDDEKMSYVVGILENLTCLAVFQTQKQSLL